MKRKYFILILSLAILYISFIDADDFAQFRGKNRDGAYQSTQLLRQWPEGGPELMWHTDSLGPSYSSVSITSDAIYTVSRRDSNEVLIKLTRKGNFVWETTIGKAWDSSFPDARCTPTIEKGRAYTITGFGVITCVDSQTGSILWQLNGLEKFDGENGRFGIAESPLIVDDKLIYTPCGEKTTMVALNKLTGETSWMSKSLHNSSMYVSPILFTHNNKEYIATVTDQYIISVNPQTGDIVWKLDFNEVFKSERGSRNTATTPLYYNGCLFVSCGYNHTGVMVRISDDGQSASVKWHNEVLDNHHGGAVKIGNYLYSSNWLNNKKGNWVCLNWETGELQYETKWGSKGAIITADNLLFCYDEQYGKVGLVEAKPDTFKVNGVLTIDKGSGQHWSHPVIDGGVLYVRHGDALMAFNIKQ